MSLNSLRDFGQAFASILKKMGCCAMSFQRGIVLVLFINEEAAELGLVAVHLIHQAAGFLAGLLCQFAEDVGHLASRPCFAIHVTAKTTIFAPLPPSTLAPAPGFFFQWRRPAARRTHPRRWSARGRDR